MSKYGDTTIRRSIVNMLAGRRIAAARKARGWSQEELAKLTGWKIDVPKDKQPEEAIGPSHIARMEQGVIGVSAENAQKFERVFDYPLEYFRGHLTDEEADVLAAQRKLKGDKGVLEDIEPRAVSRRLIPSTRGKKDVG